jgi:L-alanine-DL-glutamate epimerase-like enolase superfamily enzyme
LIEALTAQMDQLIKRNAYAKAAVEMACVDLAAKAAGLSADGLFGGRVREQIPILWVLATGDADKDIAEAEAKLEQRLHKLSLSKSAMAIPSLMSREPWRSNGRWVIMQAFELMLTRPGTRQPRPGQLPNSRLAVSTLWSSRCLLRTLKACGV